MAESRARRARGELVLDIVASLREPAEVGAMGIGPRTLVLMVPGRPWWRTLGVHAFRMRRRACAVAAGRTDRVWVQGLEAAYGLWAVVCSALFMLAVHWATK